MGMSTMQSITWESTDITHLMKVDPRGQKQCTNSYAEETDQYFGSDDKSYLGGRFSIKWRTKELVRMVVLKSSSDGYTGALFRNYCRFRPNFPESGQTLESYCHYKDAATGHLIFCYTVSVRDISSDVDALVIYPARNAANIPN